MTDELPPLWALDAAAKAVDFGGWDEARHLAFKTAHCSIIAHARTLQETAELRERLAKYERPPVDPAELKRRQDAREAAEKSFIVSGQQRVLRGEIDDDCCVQTAYRALCHRDGVTPTPVEEWGQ